MPTFASNFKSSTRLAITIPGNASSAASLSSLILAAGYSGTVSGIIISAYLAGSGSAGAQRPAFLLGNPRTQGGALVASDLTTNGEYFPIGVEYSRLVETDYANSYVLSASVTAIVALAIVLI